MTSIEHNVLINRIMKSWLILVIASVLARSTSSTLTRNLEVNTLNATSYAPKVLSYIGADHYGHYWVLFTDFTAEVYSHDFSLMNTLTLSFLSF